MLDFLKGIFTTGTGDLARPVTPPSPRIMKVYGADRVGLVGYHERGFVIAVPAEPHAAWLQQRTQSLHEKLGSVTNMTDGLRRGLEVLNKTPAGVLRRLWLLSDGHPNRETDALAGVVKQCRAAYVNVNTVGIGDEFNERLLRQIAAATHNGQFVAVNTLRELTAALVRSDAARSPSGPRRHRAETTVLVIDLSASMGEPMEGRTKIAVVEESVVRLLHYKQELFA